MQLFWLPKERQISTKKKSKHIFSLLILSSLVPIFFLVSKQATRIIYIPKRVIMEIPNQQGVEIPVPLSTSYNGIQVKLHPYNPTPQNHIISISTPINGQNPTNGPLLPPNLANDTLVVPNNNNKKMVRYRECLKNHAATMGGTATDGCGEFMPSGEEGTMKSLTCSACHCHRNFHRKEIEGDPSIYDYFHQDSHIGGIDRKVLLGHHKIGHFASTRMLSYNMGPVGSESDEEGPMPRHQTEIKKRFRTKFSQEQKEKMLDFAERVGWKIQKQEDSVVQKFCQEIGVKRRVLKVWMHNNKHNLAKKNHMMDQGQNQELLIGGVENHA